MKHATKYWVYDKVSLPVVEDVWYDDNGNVVSSYNDKPDGVDYIDETRYHELVSAFQDRVKAVAKANAEELYAHRMELQKLRADALKAVGLDPKLIIDGYIEPKPRKAKK
jgi:hypothetical protein